jgi:glutathione gamma-glutamylcysteinyltransferase
MNTRTTTTTFHKRYLPDQTTAFSSAEGRLRFVRSLHEGLAEPYFALAEQFRTQDEPAFCGLATLVMCLNAMAIDPGRVWKGVWRWFSEDMLSCCKSLDQVKDEGISLSEFARLARCNGANCDVTRGHAVTVDDFRSQVKENCSRKACHSPLNLPMPCLKFLCLNYNRGTLGQTGTGHFSPLAAYDAQTDSALILDVARFK